MKGPQNHNEIGGPGSPKFYDTGVKFQWLNVKEKYWLSEFKAPTYPAYLNLKVSFIHMQRGELTTLCIVFHRSMFHLVPQQLRDRFLACGFA